MPESDQPRLLIFDPEFELLRFDLDEGPAFVLLGDVDAGRAGRILEALEAEGAREGRVELMMEDAELTDAVSVARMVDGVRLLVGRFEHVRLIRSPQLLAHTLYRVGMIREGAPLELIEPREEEGSAS